jgi:hypothetical protein
MNTQPSSPARRITWYVQGTAWRAPSTSPEGGNCPATHRAARRGSVSGPTRAARQRSAPPTERRTSARSSIDTEAPRAPAIRAGRFPFMRAYER